MVLEAKGGEGCLREFVEAILKARGDWERVTAAFGPIAALSGDGLRDGRRASWPSLSPLLAGFVAGRA